MLSGCSTHEDGITESLSSSIHFTKQNAMLIERRRGFRLNFMTPACWTNPALACIYAFAHASTDHVTFHVRAAVGGTVGGTRIRTAGYTISNQLDLVDLLCRVADSRSTLSSGKEIDIHSAHHHFVMASTFVTPRRHPTTITPRGSRTDDDPASFTPRRTPLTPVNSQPRKQYRISKRIPRQTLHNRKKRKLSASGDNLVDPETPVNQEQNVLTDNLQHQDDNPPDPSFCGDVATPDLSLSNHCDESCCKENLETKQDLFSGSTIGVHTSSMLIRSFMCRHHLTYQAKADLLQLLQVHLPNPNQLPSSLYTFQKMNTKCSVDINPEVTEHHYCSQCYTILIDQTNSICTQCGISLVHSATPYFITISISDQLKVFLKRK